MVPGVEGVLLAAGLSSRAGAFKMEMELAGKPLLAWSLDPLAAVCRRVIVVAGARPERILRLLRRRPGVEVVVNENFAAGMLASVQAGIRLVRAGRFFLLPGDMPLVRAAVYEKLLAARGGDRGPGLPGPPRPPGAPGRPPDPGVAGRAARLQPGAVHSPPRRRDRRGRRPGNFCRSG